MKLRGTVILAVTALLGMVCAGAVRADMAVVAGQQIASPVRFEPVGGDVYAPLLYLFHPLASRLEVTTDYVRIVTRAGREVDVYFRRPEATVDGVLRPMPVLPKIVGRNILMPAKAVASLLGCAARWDAGSRTLIIHPWIRTFRVETRKNRVRLTIASEQPLSYHLLRMVDPPRLLIDIPNTDLAEIPSEVQIGKGALVSAHIAQRSRYPEEGGDAVRAVVTLTHWPSYREEMSRDGCQLQVDFPLARAVAETTARAVGAEGTGAQETEAKEASPSGPAVLSDLGFHRYSPQLAEVTLSTSGKVRFTSGDSAQPASVWVDISNADCQGRPPRCVVHDDLVSDISLKPVPDHPDTQRLTLLLSRPTPYAVVPGDNQVRVVLGRRELSDLTIAIDAGHGGPKSGAVGRTGLMEKDVTLDVALRVQRLLAETGARVVMTRTDPGSVRHLDVSTLAGLRTELQTRCAIANEAGADLFVSIHCNAVGTNQRKVRGTQTYYRKLDSVAFARVMQQEVVKMLGLPDGGVHYHPKPIIVLYQTAMPAVLVELAYISNPIDESLLASPDFRQRAAQGIVNGIRRYAEEADLLTSFGRRRAESDTGAPRSHFTDLITRGDTGETPSLRARTSHTPDTAPDTNAGGDAGGGSEAAGGGGGNAGGTPAGDAGNAGDANPER